MKHFYSHGASLLSSEAGIGASVWQNLITFESTAAKEPESAAYRSLFCSSEIHKKESASAK